MTPNAVCPLFSEASLHSRACYLLDWISFHFSKFIVLMCLVRTVVQNIRVTLWHSRLTDLQVTFRRSRHHSVQMRILCLDRNQWLYIWCMSKIRKSDTVSQCMVSWGPSLRFASEDVERIPGWIDFFHSAVWQLIETLLRTFWVGAMVSSLQMC